jgi:hypothetical protein
MSLVPFTSEVKYLISQETAAEVRHWARHRMGPDRNGLGPEGDVYSTTSIYFDTEQFDLFLRRGSHARAKFRIRNYNDTDKIFFERKMRKSDRTTKRRSEGSMEDLSRLDCIDHDWPGRWFARRLHNRRLTAVCQVRYQRTARVSAAESVPLRLTIDEHIQATAICAPAFSCAEGIEVLPNQAILELKCADSPGLFRELIRDFDLSPKAVSKYRLSVECLELLAGTTMATSMDYL